MNDNTNHNRRYLYLEMAKKMGDAARRAADQDVAATYLELAGKWVRLAEGASEYGDDDDLPDREERDADSVRAGHDLDRHL